jgi:hypothetical protein
MGSLSDHVNAGGTLPRSTPDILNVLARRRGDATVRVRLEAASANWDGCIHVDAADAVTITSRGWGSLAP